MQDESMGMMFEKASREKYRIESPQGVLSIEDLWDLPLISPHPARANLDDIAKRLHRQIRRVGEEESFVETRETTDDTVVTMFEIVKHVIKVRLAEMETRKQKRVALEKKQQILSLISKKQGEALEAKSLEELQVMVEAL
jgi:hypothetical protein